MNKRPCIDSTAQGHVKRLQELTNEDLRRWPIWRYEALSDDEAWVFPVESWEAPDRHAHIARTRFVLADGSEWWGYCSPTDDSGLDYVQPVLIAPRGHHRFWCEGLLPGPEQACSLLGKRPEQVFPVRFECIVPFEGRFVAGALTAEAAPPICRVPGPGSPTDPNR